MDEDSGPSPGSEVVGLFADREQAELAIQALASAGFPVERIGYLAPGEASEPPYGQNVVKGAIGGGAAGTLAGGILGAAVAGLIPGVGPVLAAGSLVAVLSGAATGGGAGIVGGGLLGASAAEVHGVYYAQEVRAGRSLVSVEAGERAAEARDILRTAGAFDAAGTERGTTP
jgi:hypothetical protein